MQATALLEDADKQEELRKQRRNLLLSAAIATGVGAAGTAAYMNRDAIGNWLNSMSAAKQTPTGATVTEAAAGVSGLSKLKAYAMAALPVTGAQLLHGKAVTRPWTGDPILSDELMAKAKTVFPGLTHIHTHPNGQPVLPQQAAGGTDPLGNKIVRMPKNMDPGILAHELGHVHRGPVKTVMMNQGPKLLGWLGLTGGLASDNEQTSLMANTAATAAFGTTALDELLTSRKGSQLLREAHSAVNKRDIVMPGGTRIPGADMPFSLRTRLSPYKGVPTYGMAALLPLLVHYARKQTGAFSPEAAPPN